MFERTLQDLIRGLRAHKASSRAQEEAFLAEAMGEIRDELRGKDMGLKAEAVLKMCYLMMLYPIPPPTGFAFHVVEVMSSPRYNEKQLGYMAAPMAFTGETEEVVLTVNGIKKDLMSPHLPIPPLPLSSLAHLLGLSPSLAHTLHPDLLQLLTHSSARIRKRAVLCLLPCWEAYPDGLREGFPRVRERLLDEDQGVVGATVNVVMELARRQGGKNYLPLAPELFTILTSSSNNWMLIKVVKLFAILTPLEPRLVRKLLPPLTSLISSTSAISLLYECVRTCIVGGMLDPDRPEGDALARVCVDKLGGYLRDEGGDQNLRYIALLAMVNITPTHPHMVAEYQDEIMQSLDDADLSIRMRALELITAMVDRDNIQPIVDQLLTHLAPPEEPPSQPSAMSALAAVAAKANGAKIDPAVTAQNISISQSYRLLLTQRLLEIISRDTYANVTDFEWVVSVLVDVAYISHVDLGPQIRDMLLDVVGRVKSVRGYAVRVLEKTLGDDDLRDRANESLTSCEAGLLEAAVWVCGEYASELASPLSAISSILCPSLSRAPPALVNLSVQAEAKVFGYYAARASEDWSTEKHAEAKNVVASVRSGLAPFLASRDIDIQERVFEFTQLLAFVDADLSKHVPPSKPARSGIPGVDGGFDAPDDNGEPLYPKSLFLFQPHFTGYELNSVAYRAQEAVRIPESLDLDTDIVPRGGFLEIEDDAGTEEEDEEEREVDLGVGGGAGMDELRRVLRDQEKERRGKKSKGKSKKVEGEMTAEERAERRKRKAARRDKAKNDPYYLYDEKDVDVDDVDDVDNIPIVKLDDDEMEAAPGPSTPPQPRTKSKLKRKPKSTAPPPDFDRSGEMPEGAAPALRTETAEAAAKSGLAAVDLSAPAPLRGRFDEYTDGDDLPPREVDSPAKAESPPAGGAVEAAGNGSVAPGADVPADEVQAVKIVKVRKKKTKKARAAV